jgi:hypothetical protein
VLCPEPGMSMWYGLSTHAAQPLRHRERREHRGNLIRNSMYANHANETRATIDEMQPSHPQASIVNARGFDHRLICPWRLSRDLPSEDGEGSERLRPAF